MVLRLADSSYSSTLVATIGVVAHECGYAIQHTKGYALLAFRTAVIPVVNIGSMISSQLFGRIDFGGWT